MDWYYVRDGESCGPVGFDELVGQARDGNLKPDDLVWNAPMGEEWAKASTVEGIFQKDPTVLPPLSTTRAARDADAPGPVKLVDPVRHAWQGMKLILFQPFNIGKWFALGFSAWLASLGGGGGGGGSFSGTPGDWRSAGGTDSMDISVDGMLTSLEEAWQPVREFLQSYGDFLVAGVVVLVLIGLAVGLVSLWLQSRGRFMLLDNVLNNRAEVSEPWRVWRQHGNSLFRWSFVYGLICLVVLLLILALGWPLVLKPCVDARVFVSSSVGGAIMVGVLLFAYGVVTFYIGRFLEDFIIPIMYKHNMTATEAWRKFLGLYHANIGRFLTYGLFVIVLQMCARAAIMALVVVTCFVAGCLMGIPYLGAVLRLPMTVFFRLYGVEYLAQYGGDFVVGPEGE